MIHVNYKNQICYIELCDNQKHNALGPEMIDQLIEVYASLNENKAIRIVYLKSRVQNFCAGADLSWMKNAVNLNPEQNRKDIHRLAVLYKTIRNFEGITLSYVHGKCIGGGVGLACAADFVIAHRGAIFRFSEVRLGLVPALILPYVIGRTGIQKAKKYITAASLIGAAEAYRIGLVDYLVSENDNPEIIVDQVLGNLKKAGPDALKATKKLINGFQDSLYSDDNEKMLLEMIAEARVSSEGQKGMSNFLEKKNITWDNAHV